MQEIEEKLVKGEKIPGILKVNDSSVLPDNWSEPKMTSVMRPWIKKTDPEEVKEGETFGQQLVS
jgi:hypothetical protein